MKKVYLVRHGETEGNVGNFAQTHTTPLTERGHEQAKTVAERLSHLQPEVLFASPMLRAINTAEHIAERTKLPLETIDSLHEVLSPSRLRGMKHDSPDLMAFREELQINYSDPNWTYEDGETFSNILQRAKDVVSVFESSSAERLVAVSHGRFLRFLVAYLLFGNDLTPRIEWDMAEGLRMTNTGITLAEFDGERWRLRTINDMAHFAE